MYDSSTILMVFCAYQLIFYWSLGYIWCSKSWKCTRGKKKWKFQFQRTTKIFAFLKCGSFGFHCIGRESSCKSVGIVTCKVGWLSCYFKAFSSCEMYFFFLSFIFTHYLWWFIFLALSLTIGLTSCTSIVCHAILQWFIDYVWNICRLVWNTLKQLFLRKVEFFTLIAWLIPIPITMIDEVRSYWVGIVWVELKVKCATMLSQVKCVYNFNSIAGELW